jgi:hypothetical protein
MPLRFDQERQEIIGRRAYPEVIDRGQDALGLLALPRAPHRGEQAFAVHLDLAVVRLQHVQHFLEAGRLPRHRHGRIEHLAIGRAAHDLVLVVHRLAVGVALVLFVAGVVAEEMQVPMAHVIDEREAGKADRDVAGDLDRVLLVDVLVNAGDRRMPERRAIADLRGLIE